MDMPSLCTVCLGDNPYLRMERLAFGAKVCHFNHQPYQGYRWKPHNGRYKETVICADVSKERNICQCCLNDLKYGLAVGVRDTLLAHSNTPRIAAPNSAVGQQYHAQNHVAQDYANSLTFADHIQNASSNAQLEKFASSRHTSTLATAGTSHSTSIPTAVAFRNLPKLCSFWLGGLCKRTSTGRCPFRPCCGTYVFPEIARDKPLHARLVEALTTTGPVKLQLTLDKDIRDALKSALRSNTSESIKKRVRGDDDESARTLAKISDASSRLAPPADASITTLWVGNVSEHLTEQDLFNALYVHGSIATIHMARASKCAFVKYEQRESAEAAVKQLCHSLVVQGASLSLNWAKPTASSGAPPIPLDRPPPPPGYASYPALMGELGAVGVSQGGSKKARVGSASTGGIYPSMDPSRMGSAGTYVAEGSADA